MLTNHLNLKIIIQRKRVIFEHFLSKYGQIPGLVTQKIDFCDAFELCRGALRSYIVQKSIFTGFHTGSLAHWYSVSSQFCWTKNFPIFPNLRVSKIFSILKKILKISSYILNFVVWHFWSKFSKTIVIRT